MTHDSEPNAIPHLPDPTPWPLVLALGLTLSGGGLVLGNISLGDAEIPGIYVSVLGLLLFIGALGNLIREDIRLSDHASHND